MTRRIKQDPATRGIAVMALTAFAMNGDEQKAIEAGCDGYITKPVIPGPSVNAFVRFSIRAPNRRVPTPRSPPARLRRFLRPK